MSTDRTHPEESPQTSGPAEIATAEAARAAREAEVWFARIEDGRLSPADRSAFENWKSRSAANRAAYEELAAIWENPNLEVALREAARNEVGQDEIAAHRAARRWQVPLGIAAAISVVAVAITITRFGGESSEPLESRVAYETVVGERRTVQLTDGSSITINTATRVHMTFGAQQRYVQLERGQVYVDVKRDGRPFIVEGGSGRVTVLGTAFDVQVSEGEMDVAVERGRVAVGTASSPHSSQVLHPGQSVTVRGGRVGPMRVTRGEVADWRDGWLDFSNESLPQVVRELNRYHSGEIRLGREELAQLRVTGRINLTDVDHAVRVLARSMGLTARQTASGEITLD